MNQDLTKILKRLGPTPTPFPIYSTAFLGDAMEKLGMQNRISDPGIRPLIPFTRMIGIAVTLKLELATKPDVERTTACYGSAFKAGKQVCSPVLVIEAPFTKYGTLGSGAAYVFKNQCGFVGAVVDGVVRDTDELARMQFPVFYRYISPQHIDGIARGVSANDPVTVGEVNVSPGDIIVGDNDGVLSIPQADIFRVIEVADEIMALEARILGDMDQGKSYQETGEQYFKELLQKVEM